MDDVEFLTTREFLERNRGRISETTLRRYIASGVIPVVQATRKGKIWIPSDALAVLMDEQQQAATGETAQPYLRDKHARTLEALVRATIDALQDLLDSGELSATKVTTSGKR